MYIHTYTHTGLLLQKRGYGKTSFHINTFFILNGYAEFHLFIII